MQCICEKLGADFSELAPVCKGNLWLFRDLPGETLMAMSHSATMNSKVSRKRLTKKLFNCKSQNSFIWREE